MSSYSGPSPTARHRAFTLEDMVPSATFCVVCWAAALLWTLPASRADITGAGPPVGLPTGFIDVSVQGGLRTVTALVFLDVSRYLVAQQNGVVFITDVRSIPAPALPQNPNRAAIAPLLCYHRTNHSMLYFLPCVDA